MKLNIFKKEKSLIVPQAISLQKNNFEDMMQYVLSFDLQKSDIEKNNSILNVKNSEEVKKINWFIPKVEHIFYGGVYTILRFANYFQEKGIQNTLIFYGGEPGIDEIKSKITSEFKTLSESTFIYFQDNYEELPECDASISTLWNSCYISARFNKTKKKFYFIQDYEPLFYAAGTVNSVFAEATYRMGFRCITNTPGLADFINVQHGAECSSFYPCVDKNIYFIDEEKFKENFNKDKFTIVFYGRPNKNRNAFEIGLASLIKIKEKYKEKVEIFSVGDDWSEDDYGVSGKIKNLGRLKSLKEVAEIYRKSDIGLTMMFSKHPSYQPFEFMACGCAVVANYNDANTWFLKNGYNCLISEPLPSCLADKISELIDNKDLRRKIVDAGLKEIAKHEWKSECQKILDYINR